VEVGDREVYLWGAPVELDKTDRIKTLRDRLLNQLVLNAFEMSPRNMDEYIAAIRAYRPKCVYGYASSVRCLLRSTRVGAARRAGAARRMYDGRAAVCTPARLIGRFAAPWPMSSAAATSASLPTKHPRDSCCS
jgi:hypothetical protein